MSNQAVGGVYQQIIQDVIDSSRVDFEEGGVDEVVLEELKKGWQRKLSQLNVAAFPWDPKPDPTPANNAPPPAPLPAQQASVADYTQAQLSPPPPSVLPHPVPMAPSPSLNQNGNAGVVKAEPGSAKSDVTIKQEPGLQNGPLPQAHHAYTTAQMRGPQVPVAAQRAAQALEGQFGPRAAASISAIHSGMSQASQMNQGQGPGQQGPRPASVAPQHMNAAQQYRQQVANATAIQQQRAQQSAQASGQNGIGNSQMDGPSDALEGVLMQRDANGNPVVLGRIEIDSMLHEHIAARAKRMEGGGLMLPLREAARHTSLPAKKRNAHGTSQLDGLDDDIKDEELDDDAINSDLDDPDDELEDEEDDDEAMGHIMLCMYDKVQRVKNKWKCTLKDGVLTVNGREYVFHKATGEYEW